MLATKICSYQMTTNTVKNMKSFSANLKLIGLPNAAYYDELIILTSKTYQKFFGMNKDATKKYKPKKSRMQQKTKDTFKRNVEDKKMGYKQEVDDL